MAATSAQSIQIGMFILDVLRHDDIEPLSSIIKLMNDDGCIGWRQFWPHDFTADEVIPHLQDHLQQGRVSAWREQPFQDELSPAVGAVDICAEQQTLWFALTPKGRQLWNEWEAPQEPDARRREASDHA